MSGAPYWGSDISGFKCFTTDGPRDKEVYLRWVQFGAVSPIMMDQNACYTVSGHQPKWTLWSDAETVALTDDARQHGAQGSGTPAGTGAPAGAASGGRGRGTHTTEEAVQ